jgi:ABC-type transport system involved in cytochrome c biogenesis permease subunit
MAVATLCCAVASAASWRSLISEGRRLKTVGRVAVLIVIGILAGAFVIRAMQRDATWHPLNAHLDGLILLCGLLAVTISYMQWTGRMRGVELFALPLLTLLLAWAICAAAWTFRPFSILTVWDAAHALTVYLGLVAVALAGVSGMMYLFVARQLRRRDNPAATFRRLRSLGNLESVERIMIQSASVGYVLISLALITGIIILTRRPESLGAEWWRSPKIIGSLIGWIIYALVMHVRLTATWRGRRAAWLSIIGLIVLLVVVGLAISQNGTEPARSTPPPATPDHAPAAQPPSHPQPPETGGL